MNKYLLLILVGVESLSVPKSLIHTKQVVTIGPSCNSYKMMKELHENGASIFRINMSHSKKKETYDIVEKLKKIRENSEDKLEILVDLQGPKYRVGDVKEGEMILEEGSRVELTTNMNDDKSEIILPHKELFERISYGDKILLDDGMLELKVEISDKEKNMVCRVVRGGVLKSRKGVNIPNIETHGLKLTNKDIEDIKIINKMDVDWVALSFVENSGDMVRLRSLIKNNVKVMAKIERPMAVEDIENIIDVSDGVMIARGDLGIEMGIERVPFAQKMIISECRKRGCDVIVATQVMESMINCPVPTRAEVSDIANAVLDGASGIMLSGETSVGKYPVECVKVQRKIIKEIENYKKVYMRRDDDGDILGLCIIRSYIDEN